MTDANDRCAQGTAALGSETSPTCSSSERQNLKASIGASMYGPLPTPSVHKYTPETVDKFITENEKLRQENKELSRENKELAAENDSLAYPGGQAGEGIPSFVTPSGKRFPEDFLVRENPRGWIDVDDAHGATGISNPESDPAVEKFRRCERFVQNIIDQLEGDVKVLTIKGWNDFMNAKPEEFELMLKFGMKGFDIGRIIKAQEKMFGVSPQDFLDIPNIDDIEESEEDEQLDYQDPPQQYLTEAIYCTQNSTTCALKKSVQLIDFQLPTGPNQLFQRFKTYDLVITVLNPEPRPLRLIALPHWFQLVELMINGEHKIAYHGGRHIEHVFNRAPKHLRKVGAEMLGYATHYPEDLEDAVTVVPPNSTRTYRLPLVPLFTWLNDIPLRHIAAQMVLRFYLNTGDMVILNMDDPAFSHTVEIVSINTIATGYKQAPWAESSISVGGPGYRSNHDSYEALVEYPFYRHDNLHDVEPHGGCPQMLGPTSLHFPKGRCTEIYWDIHDNMMTPHTAGSYITRLRTYGKFYMHEAHGAILNHANYTPESIDWTLGRERNRRPEDSFYHTKGPGLRFAKSGMVPWEYYQLTGQETVSIAPPVNQGWQNARLTSYITLQANLKIDEKGNVTFEPIQ